MITERPLRLTHIITGLDVGGAEIMLYELVKATDRGRFHTTVVSLSAPGPMQPRIESLGIAVHSLGIPGRRLSPLGPVRLARLLRALKPDLVQTWMYHADLAGGLAARLATRAPVVWGLHNSSLDRGTTSPTTLATVSVCAKLSRLVPVKIVSCSRAAMQIHTDLGYDAGRMVVIPNGFDLAVYQPNPDHYAAVRREMGLGHDAVLVGLVARYHPQKDHENFIAAAARLVARYPSVYFVMAGKDAAEGNPELARWVRDTGEPGRFRLLGIRSDMPRIQAALDIAVSSSCSGEAFPLVLGEAMACSVPCVATDVGDSALILGDTGQVVPPHDAGALAAAIDELLMMPVGQRRNLGALARQRIRDKFALPAVAETYQSLYLALCAAGY